MKKVVFFAIAIVLVSFVSSCAINADQCPGVAGVESSVLPA
ncbi:MAG: Uncharacterised protein [Cryomorphaceae bacterium]|nr:MAG: Uncharacterised protein [Cryomorphaceae bacterium]|tara:strand:+ start:2212 stop:2334 length:123 start_codon:yes stop_codon:yes gene_type:complete